MTEEDLNDLAADPEAAQQLMQKQVMGQAHSKMKNTVSDIEEKYRAILKLEEVRKPRLIFFIIQANLLFSSVL